MLFWHCTIRISKNKIRCASLKLNFTFLHVIKYEERTEKFFSGSHLLIDQFNFSPYSVKIAKTCRKGQGRSLCLKSFHHLRLHTDHNHPMNIVNSNKTRTLTKICL